MESYELLQHTADIRLKLQGEDLEGILRAGLAGLFEIISGISKFSPVKQKWEKSFSFEIESKDSETLIVDFLNEALFVVETEKMLPVAVGFEELTEDRAKGKFFLTPDFPAQKHVKAATYHELEIIKNNQGLLETVITLDI